MESNKYKHLVSKLFSLADIEINGSNPWDVIVRLGMITLSEAGKILSIDTMNAFIKCGSIFCFQALVLSEQEVKISFGRSCCLRMAFLMAIVRLDNFRR